jgi:hypothetical protein
MVFPLWRQPEGVVEHRKISNSKHQITNKSQIPILVLRTPHPAGGSPVSMTKTKDKLRILVIVICLIFVICDLEFLIL